MTTRSPGGGACPGCRPSQILCRAASERANPLLLHCSIADASRMAIGRHDATMRACGKLTRVPIDGHWAASHDVKEPAAMTDIVIVSAARTPVGSFNGALVQPAGPRTGQDRHPGGDRARRHRGRRRRRGDHGPGAAGRRRPGPGPPGLGQRRHPGGEPGLEPQPAVRLGPARRGARRPADRRRRRRHRRRRRPGEHEPVAARRRTCATARRWATWPSSTP